MDNVFFNIKIQLFGNSIILLFTSKNIFQKIKKDMILKNQKKIFTVSVVLLMSLFWLSKLVVNLILNSYTSAFTPWNFKFHKLVNIYFNLFNILHIYKITTLLVHRTVRRLNLIESYAGQSDIHKYLLLMPNGPALWCPASNL